MIRVKNISIICPDTPEGRMWASALEKEIRAFRAPASVRRKTGLLRAADTEEPWLIVMCSPEARQDPMQLLRRQLQGYRLPMPCHRLS